MQREGYKRCPKCGETKRVGLFHRDASQRDGRYAWCGVCSRAKMQRRYWAGRTPSPPRPTAPVPPGEIDPAFGNWLAGFIDGEGSFIIGLKPGGGACVRFILELRADDVRVLEEMRSRTGLGTVTVWDRGMKGRVAKWNVNRKAESLALVAFLDRFPLRAKKARDYAIWREAVLLWNDMGDTRGRDWSEIGALKAQLAETRRFRAGDAVPAFVRP